MMDPIAIPHLFRIDGDVSWRIVSAEADRLVDALERAALPDLAAAVARARQDVIAAWPEKCTRRSPEAAVGYLRALDAFHAARRRALEALAAAPRLPIAA